MHISYAKYHINQVVYVKGVAKGGASKGSNTGVKGSCHVIDSYFSDQYLSNSKIEGWHYLVRKKTSIGTWVFELHESNLSAHP